LFELEPLGAVDLRHLDPPTRAGRPLEQERVAVHRRHVEVSSESPGVDDLAGLLLDLSQIIRLANRRLGAELLLELPQRRRERVVFEVVLALRDRPRAEVALGPRGSARVDEQDFERAVATAAVQNDPGASTGT